MRQLGGWSSFSFMHSPFARLPSHQGENKKTLFPTLQGKGQPHFVARRSTDELPQASFPHSFKLQHRVP